MMKHHLAWAALAAAAFCSTPALADTTSLVGDKDCFGLGGSCPDGTLWRDQLGGTFFTSNQTAGDPSFTDKWSADVDVTYQHIYALTPGATSASLVVKTAGIADNRGPWDVLFNGTLLGQFTVNTDANAFQEVRTFSFNVGVGLLTGHDTVLLKINDPTVNDGYSIDYSELNIMTAAVPEPETYALMLGGLALIGGLTRRRRG